MKALGDFEVFVGEIKRRRELVVYKSLQMKCESYEDYLALQAEYKALTEVIELPQELSETAMEIRERTNE